MSQNCSTAAAGAQHEQSALVPAIKQQQKDTIMNDWVGSSHRGGASYAQRAPEHARVSPANDDSGVRSLTPQQQEMLADAINRSPAEQVMDIMQIIQGSIGPSANEIEIDLRKDLDASTQLELWRYMAMPREIVEVKTPVQACEILRHSQVTALRLFFNERISNSDAYDLSVALLANTGLEELDIDCGDFLSKDFEELRGTLISKESLLKLSFHGKTIGQTRATAISKLLLHNESIQEMDFSKAETTGEIDDRLFKTLAKSPLKKLNLCGFLHGKGLHIFLETMRKKKNDAIMELNLSSCAIGESTVPKLAEAIQGMVSLRRLILNSNQLDSDGSSWIAGSLKQHQSLLEIDLSGNNIKDAGILGLARCLKINKVLKKLNLGSNGLGIDGVRALIAALKDNTSLSELDLASNDIKDTGAAIIADELSNTSLKRLSLSCCKLSDQGAKVVVESLAHQLHELNLAGNVIKNEGVEALATLLRKEKCTVKVLSFRGNPLEARPLRSLIESLKENKSLQDLDLSGCSISSTVASALGFVLSGENSTLLKLDLTRPICDDHGQMPALADGWVQDKPNVFRRRQTMLLLKLGMEMDGKLHAVSSGRRPSNMKRGKPKNCDQRKTRRDNAAHTDDISVESGSSGITTPRPMLSIRGAHLERRTQYPSRARRKSSAETAFRPTELAGAAETAARCIRVVAGNSGKPKNCDVVDLTDDASVESESLGTRGSVLCVQGVHSDRQTQRPSQLSGARRNSSAETMITSSRPAELVGAAETAVRHIRAANRVAAVANTSVPEGETNAAPDRKQEGRLQHLSYEEFKELAKIFERQDDLECKLDKEWMELELKARRDREAGDIFAESAARKKQKLVEVQERHRNMTLAFKGMLGGARHGPTAPSEK